MKKKNLKFKQRGFFLIEAMVALAVFGTLAALATQKYVESQQESTAEYAGQRIAQYNNAVRSYLAANATTIPSPTTFVGVNWLRTAATCGAGNGTGTVNYLPCTFSPNLPFGMTYSTTFTRAGGVLTANTDVGRILLDGGVRIDLSEIVRKSAQGADTQTHSPVSASTFTDFTVDYTVGVNEGDVHALASNNNSTDAWLRVDGSNQMLANLNVGGNDVISARDVNLTRDVNAGRNVNATNNLNVGNNATITNLTRSGTFQAQNSSRTYANGLSIGREAGGASGPKITSDYAGNIYNDAKTGASLYNNWYGQGNVFTRTGSGNNYVFGNGWSLATYNNAGAANVAPMSATGSFYVNDGYIRSKHLWLSQLVDRLPRIVFMSSEIVYHGTLVAKPACAAGGFPKIYIIPRLWKGYNTATTNDYYHNWYAMNINASLWQTFLLMERPVWNGGGPWPSWAFVGIAQLYCQYA